MLRLVLMRHGKSDWDAAYSSDHERPLAPRGERNARAMGTLLREAGEVPDLVVASTAVRARTTAEFARIAGGWPGRLELEPQLYGSGPSEALAITGIHGTDQKRLMLVGHEPTLSMLMTALTGARAPVKTATVVGIDLPIAEWHDASSAQGTLAYLIHPRLFAKDG